MHGACQVTHVGHMSDVQSPVAAAALNLRAVVTVMLPMVTGKAGVLCPSAISTTIQQRQQQQAAGQLRTKR
jgi:hypothetical protein